MNRKNAIEVIFFIAVVLTIAVLMVQTDDLQEALDEKETVISDMGKTVDVLETKIEKKDDDLINVRQESTDLRSNLEKTTATVDTLKNDKEKLSKENDALRKEIDSLKKTKPVVKKTSTKIPSRGAVSSTQTIYFEATAYTAYCTGCSGTTTTGINLRANPSAKVVAVDPSVIPLGTKLYVDGYGYAVAGDTGGDIKGHRMDLFMSSKSDALAFGRKTVQVKVLN
jgi:3D (Asp-Asp-Asp) domain-containing protein